MTMYEAKEIGINLLIKAGVPEYDTEAVKLLEYVCGKKYFLHMEDQLTPKQETAYLEVLALREQHIPFQHITGSMWFYGYEFHVRKGVLIPRMDTECLVSKAIELAPDRNIKYLDLCTGSGCIGIAFWLQRRYYNVRVDLGVLSDISPEAVTLAKENVEYLSGDTETTEAWWTEKMRTHVEVIQSDLFDNLEGHKFDLIMSNPPYIAASEMEGLMPEVRDHDPRIALTDEGDGLSFYRRIAAGARKHLKKDGYLVLEIGYDQGQAVPEILREAGYRDIKVTKDLAGLDRVVTAFK